MCVHNMFIQSALHILCSVVAPPPPPICKASLLDCVFAVHTAHHRAVVHPLDIPEDYTLEVTRAPMETTSAIVGYVFE